MVTEKSGQTGEKIELAYYRIEAPLLRRIRALQQEARYDLGFNKEVPEEVAHTVAMQATAMAPISIDVGRLARQTWWLTSVRSPWRP